MKFSHAKTAGLVAVPLLAALAVVAFVLNSAAEEPPRFVPLTSAELTEAGYAEISLLLIAAIRDSSFGPTAAIVDGETVQTPGALDDVSREADEERPERTQDAALRVREIGEDIALSTQGESQVEALIRRYRATEERATEHNSSLAIDTSSVEATDARATHDRQTNTVLVELKYYVVEAYRSGVVSEGYEIVNVVFDAANGAVLSVTPITQEDKASLW